MRHGHGFRHAPDLESGAARHTLLVVYAEMLLQVCREFPSVRDFRSLTITEIRFFYQSLRTELVERTKPVRPVK